MAIRYAGILVAACLFVLGPAAGASAAPPDDDQRILQILNRLAFGPTAEDLQHVKTIGVAHYIAEQLDPAAIPEPAELRARLEALDTLRLDAVQLRRTYGPPPATGGIRPAPELLKMQRERARIVIEEARTARVLRAVISPRQLEEVMVDFWFNHFNVFAGKGLDNLWIGIYEEQAIRPFALGHFRDLLFATAKHPAMLVYLDNTMNMAKPGAPNGGGLNENYARELMELHTLGVDGGYTQDDVISLARILTGWRVNLPNAPDFAQYAAVFVGARHDYGPKTFLGREIQSRGKGEGEEALDILARSPATAHHISYELAQYFVADDPPKALVDRLAQRFRDSDGDIRAVLQSLFASREFQGSAGDKYKTPLQFVVSAVRAAGVSPANPRPLLNALARLGMPLYGCQTPDGYKNTEAAWLSPDATTMRIGFATALARGNLPVAGAADQMAPEARPEPHPLDAAPLMALLEPVLSDATRAAVAEAPPGLRAAMILGSPDFMRR